MSLPKQTDMSKFKAKAFVVLHVMQIKHVTKLLGKIRAKLHQKMKKPQTLTVITV